MATFKEEAATEKIEVDDLEEEITCAVCQEHFQDPKVLPCCHYYCKRCVEALVETAGTQGSAKSFSCPECRTDITIPDNDPDKLPTAFFINRLIALFSKRETETEKQFSTTDTELPPPIATCSVHDELMKIYCYDCCVMICRDCTVVDHKGHKYEFVKKVAPEIKVKLTRELAPLKMAHSSLSSALESVESSKANVESSGVAIAASIKKSFQMLHDIIEERKLELLMQATKTVNSKIDQLRVQEKEIQTIAGTVLNVVEFVERSIGNMSEEELVTTHERILRQISEEEKRQRAIMTVLNLKPVEEADFVFDMNCAEGLKRLLREEAAVRTATSMQRKVVGVDPKISSYEKSQRLRRGEGEAHSATSMQLKVVWVDPKITSYENSHQLSAIKAVEGISVFGTTSASEALKVLLEKDPKVEYRVITAGTGGKDFIDKLRAKGVHCPVLVYCGNLDKNLKWARKFSNVKVTVDPSAMFKFATWKHEA